MRQALLLMMMLGVFAVVAAVTIGVIGISGGGTIETAVQDSAAEPAAAADPGVSMKDVIAVLDTFAAGAHDLHLPEDINAAIHNTFTPAASEPRSTANELAVLGGEGLVGSGGGSGIVAIGGKGELFADAVGASGEANGAVGQLAAIGNEGIATVPEHPIGLGQIAIIGNGGGAAPAADQTGLQGGGDHAPGGPPAKAPLATKYDPAYALYALAANPADADASYSLGIMLRDGAGVSRDDGAAARYLEAAAKLGHSSAQRALGNLFLDGRGVSQNYIAAYAWLDLAAETLSGPARTAAIADRDRALSMMTPQEVTAARNLANELRPQSAALDAAHG